MGKIIILANNSGGLYDFRNNLISELIAKDNDVIAYTPYDTNIEDLKALGVDLRELPVDRRGLNPFKDLKPTVDLTQLINNDRIKTHKVLCTIN